MRADRRFEQVRAAIEQIGPADRVCTLYNQRDEEVAIAVSYIRTGLDREELCVCVVDDGGTRILDDSRRRASTSMQRYARAASRRTAPSRSP